MSDLFGTEDYTGQSITYSSSPLTGATLGSTLDTGVRSPKETSQSSIEQIGDVISQLGQTVLGGIAISRIPSNQIASVATQTQGRITSTVVGTPQSIAASSITPILLIGLLVIGAVLLFKKL